jgi:hypothetical protein
MSTEIKVPKLPESVADATLVTWHKKPGDAVTRDENLADLETDKVVLEVPAPVAGVLKEIRDWKAPMAWSQHRGVAPHDDDLGWQGHGEHGRGPYVQRARRRHTRHRAEGY